MEKRLFYGAQSTPEANEKFQSNPTSSTFSLASNKSCSSTSYSIPPPQVIPFPLIHLKSSPNGATSATRLDNDNDEITDQINDLDGFRNATTDIHSSLLRVDKVITRNYACFFTLPNQLQLGIARTEEYKPQVNTMIVTSCMCQGHDEGMESQNDYTEKEIKNYLNDDPWAKALFTYDISTKGTLLSLLDRDCQHNPGNFEIRKMEKRTLRETVIQANHPPTQRTVCMIPLVRKYSSGGSESTDISYLPPTPRNTSKSQEDALEYLNTKAAIDKNISAQRTALYSKIKFGESQEVTSGISSQEDEPYFSIDDAVSSKAIFTEGDFLTKCSITNKPNKEKTWPYSIVRLQPFGKHLRKSRSISSTGSQFSHETGVNSQSLKSCEGNAAETSVQRSPSSCCLAQEKPSSTVMRKKFKQRREPS